MKIAVLSGKGGTGKTFVSVNLAATAGKATYIDCDVEEPNGRLFFKPDKKEKLTVTVHIPTFDANKCTGCRKCVDFCRFNALVYIKDKPMLFTEVCHSCGGCSLVCPERAVIESEKPVGFIEIGTRGKVRVVTGVMELGEVSGIPIIKAALAHAAPQDELTIIDCPPGSACPVMESVQSADYCILVAEQTAFGLHNLAMVYELVTLLGRPCGVVINKADREYLPLDGFLAEHRIPVLCRIPYSDHLAALGANAEIAARRSEDISALFRGLLDGIRKGAAT